MIKHACIILCTYNEVDNVPILIPRIYEQSKKIHSHDLHLIVVDDNSPDGTQDCIRELMKKYPKFLHLISGEKKGLGEAKKRGITYAFEKLDPDLIVEIDADLQHDAALLPLFILLSTHGFDLVIGSRYVPGGAAPRSSLRRRLMSRIGNSLVRIAGGLPPIRDCTSGYRCIKADLIKECDMTSLSTRGFSFLSTILCELINNGARVIEVPIIVSERIQGESKLTFHDQIEFLINIGRIRYRRMAEHKNI
jgi:dolichol-phosphate mannosyltransferase